MTSPAEDAGLAQVLLDRVNTPRLPRALELKAKVDRGEKLEKFEVDYLADILADIHSIKALVDRNPAYQEIVLKGIGLYKEISEKALANEKAG